MPAKRILVVDDESSIRKIITTQLKRAGYEVAEAADAFAGLEILARDSAFDLVVSDLMMPRMDGIEFRKKILASPNLAHIPFVMLTASRHTEDKVTSYELDVAAYITKPFEAQELLARIASILRQLDGRVRYTAEERLRAIQQLSVTLNHEINNPLSTVLGQAELLLMKPEPPAAEKFHRMVKEIRDAAVRIRDVIRKVHQIRSIATKTYLSDIEMVDLDLASGAQPEESKSS